MRQVNSHERYGSSTRCQLKQGSANGSFAAKMDDQYSFNNIDNLLFQCALQTRELTQKKNELNQQIKVFRDDIAERKSYIQTIQSKTQKLEEKIMALQSTLMHNKACAKSIKTTNSLLGQYEQSLKEELASRKVSYDNDTKVFEEKIADCKKKFQSYKDFYCQSPLAQKLLALQAENEEIESRIKACDDQISVKQKELDNLRGPGAHSSAAENLSDSTPEQQPLPLPEKQPYPQTEEDSGPSIDISSLHLNQTKDDENTSVDANDEEIFEERKVQDTPTHSFVPEEETTRVLSRQQLKEQRWPDEKHTEEKTQETGPEDQVMESESAVSDKEDAEMEAGDARESVKSPSQENEGPAASSQLSTQQTNPQSSPATVKMTPATPNFSFNFSPASSPHHGTSDTKSPPFLFSLNADPSTPGFTGFGFDAGSSQDEDSSFAFTEPIFNEKKTSEPKASDSSDFLFGQQDQSEDFQFAFSAKSPGPTKKDSTADEFPFSFNF
ncbi:protein SIX6OS1 [Cheilinus undulatus]|uniref:protein SIX6OS1 n=1 Tax=Cheilinus undulatus TaxID=241271 RepID=UPI001BD2A43A|nr:protein SIX6OS1 [Cheilinus undulatus]